MTLATKIKVLLVDDELDITTTLKQGLEKHGFEVSVYNDPRKAIEEYQPNHYDLHVLDIRMPGMNGFDLARRIWLQDPKAQICFLTAFEIYETEANKVFKDLKSRCFLKKPISTTVLARHLQKHLKSMQQD